MEINQQTSFPPTIGDSYKNGWDQLWKYFLELLLIGILSFLFSLPFTLPGLAGNFTYDLEKIEDPAMLLARFYPFILFFIAYAVLVVNPLKYGINYAYLKAARGEKVEIRDMFSFTANYVNVVFASLLTGFIIGIGICMLIIPGIVFACKLAFVPYLVIDKKMAVIEALKASWRMTDGHAIDIFVMGLLAIPIAIIGLCLLFFGIFPAAMWIKLAFASIYHSVDKMKAPKI